MPERPRIERRVSLITQFFGSAHRSSSYAPDGEIITVTMNYSIGSIGGSMRCRRVNSGGAVNSRFEAVEVPGDCDIDATQVAKIGGNAWL